MKKNTLRILATLLLLLSFVTIGESLKTAAYQVAPQMKSTWDVVTWQNKVWEENATYRDIRYVNGINYYDTYSPATTQGDAFRGQSRVHYVRHYTTY